MKGDLQNLGRRVNHIETKFTNVGSFENKMKDMVGNFEGIMKEIEDKLAKMGNFEGKMEDVEAKLEKMGSLENKMKDMEVKLTNIKGTIQEKKISKSLKKYGMINPIYNLSPKIKR